MYDPSAGKWLSQDPIGFLGGDADLSRYVGNSPVNATDPSGLAAGWWNDIREGIRGVIAVGPVDAWDAAFGEDEDAARAFASEYSNDDWEQNAARHGVWQARLSFRHGVDDAREIGDAHELGEEETLDSRIDQYNNAVAREIGQEAESLEQISELVEDALDNGQFITDPNDPRIPGGPGGNAPADSTSSSSTSSNSSSGDTSSIDTSSGY